MCLSSDVHDVKMIVFSSSFVCLLVTPLDNTVFLYVVK